MGDRLPLSVNGNRLRWWNRLRWRLGMAPFRRCPNQHARRNIYGDEILDAGGMRSRCVWCEKRWPHLAPLPGDPAVALWAEDPNGPALADGDSVTTWPNAGRDRARKQWHG